MGIIDRVSKKQGTDVTFGTLVPQHRVESGFCVL